MEDSVYARISIKVPQKVTFFLNDHVNKGPFDLKPAIDLRKCFYVEIIFSVFFSQVFFAMISKTAVKISRKF